MFRLDFIANVVHTSKNSKGNYFMVGLADDKYNYKNYIIFQKPIKLGKYDDPNAAINGTYIECNGDICYNGCTKAILTKNKFSLIIKDTPIGIDISNVQITDKFISYLKEIFGVVLIVDI